MIASDPPKPPNELDVEIEMLDPAAVEQTIELVLEAFLLSTWEERFEGWVYWVVPWPDLHLQIEKATGADGQTAERLTRKAIVEIRKAAGLMVTDIGFDDHNDWPAPPDNVAAVWVWRPRRVYLEELVEARRR